MIKRALIIVSIILGIVVIPNWIGEMYIFKRFEKWGWLHEWKEAPRWLEGMVVIIICTAALAILFVIVSLAWEWIRRGEVHGKVKRHK